MTANMSSIDVTEKPPSVEEYLRLRREGGLSAFSTEAAEIGLKGTLFSVTLRHAHQPIGMGRIVGDGGCFVQIVDIAVDPRFRGIGLGTLVMSSLMNWAKKRAAGNGLSKPTCGCSCEQTL